VPAERKRHQLTKRNVPSKGLAAKETGSWDAKKQKERNAKKRRRAPMGHGKGEVRRSGG